MSCSLHVSRSASASLAFARRVPWHVGEQRPCLSALGQAKLAACSIHRDVVSFRRLRTQRSASSALEPSEAAIAEKKKDLFKGCSTILQELKGLDFSAVEATFYFKLSAFPPKGTAKDFDFSRAQACLEQLIQSKSEDYQGSREALEDVEAMTVTQAMLSEIWRWRRRGGGMNDEDDSRPHQHALHDIQQMEKEDIDRITSSLLDTLPLSDKQKSEMAGAVEQATMAGINGAVWGSMVFCLLLLLAFNFLRS